MDDGTAAREHSSGGYRRKIVDIERLHQVVTALRQSGVESGRAPRVVQCHGCFDIVHPGHIRYLQFARSQGDLLVVSITGDALIDKGEQRPYIPQELRAENLAALEFVDYVVVDSHREACALLGKIKPDVYVKGAEYATSRDPRFLAEREVVESYGGRVIFSSGQVVFSSSRLIESMSGDDDLAARRLAAVCRRHGLDVDCLCGFVESFARKRVVVVGDTVLERYVLCDATQIAEESPMMSLNELDSRDFLGGAALVAVLAAGWGAEVTLVTRLGQDRSAARAAEMLEHAGVEVRAVRRGPALPRRTRFLVGEKKLLRVNRAPADPLDSIGEREAAEALLAGAIKTDVAIMLDGGCGMMTPGLVQRLGATFRRRVPVIAAGAAEPDGDWRLARHADLLCASERQLRAAAADEAAGGLATVAYRALQVTAAKRLICALGSPGLVCFDRPSHDPESARWNDRLHSEFLSDVGPRAVDELGAGESILTAASLALSAGASLMQAAYIGMAASILQRRTVGPTPIAVEELHRWLERRPELARDEAADEDLSIAPPGGFINGNFHDAIVDDAHVHAAR